MLLLKSLLLLLLWLILDFFFELSLLSLDFLCLLDLFLVD